MDTVTPALYEDKMIQYPIMNMDAPKLEDDINPPDQNQVVVPFLSHLK